MSLLSFLTALRKDADGLNYVDSSRLIYTHKDAPATGDVHVSTALGEKTPKDKKKKKGPEGEDEALHLPVTNMTLAAQAITGQAKQTTAKTAFPKFIDLRPDFPATAVQVPIESQKFAEVLKVDETLGLVLGWAIVCKKDGCDYWDLQDDHIPETSMLSAAIDFMQNSRVAKEMHTGEASGSVVFAFPLTEDIAKAFGIETKTTGLMIAMKPDSDDMLAKFRDGTLTGFSIGGHRLEDEEVAAP